MVVAAMGIFSACTPDAAEAPTINVSVVGSPEYTQGSEVTYVVTAQTASDKDVLNQLTITGTGLNPNYSYSYPAETTMSTDSFTMVIPTDVPAGTDVELTFEVTTDKDTSATATQSFTVTSALTEKSDLVSDGSYTSSSQNGFDVESLSIVGVDKGEDFVLIHNSAVGNAIYSPNAKQLSTLYAYNNVTYSNTTETKLQKVTKDFATVDAAYLSSLAVTSSTVTGGGIGVEKLAVGDVIAFETTDGTKGVIKITAVDNAKSTSAISKITFDLKMLKAATAK